MKFLNRLLAVVLIAGVAAAAGFIGLAPSYTVPVVMYHQVKDVAQPGADTVSPANLRRQWEFLRDNGFQVIGTGALVKAIEDGQRLPFKSVVITFDDGYVEGYTEVLPLIREFGFPVTMFISPEFFDRDGYLSREQIAALRDAGVTLGSHGMTQAYLPDLDEQGLKYEIVTSKDQLELFLNRPVNVLAYPVGGFNEPIKELLQSAGYRAGFATNRGNDRFNRDRYEINRIRLSNRDDSDVILWAKLSGYYNFFRKLKAPN